MIKKVEYNKCSDYNYLVELVNILNKPNYMNINENDLNEFKYKERLCKDVQLLLEYDKYGYTRPNDLRQTIYNYFGNLERYKKRGIGYHGLTSMQDIDILLSKYKGITSFSRELSVAFIFANYKTLSNTSHYIVRSFCNYFNFCGFLKDLKPILKPIENTLDIFISESEYWKIWDDNYTLKNVRDLIRGSDYLTQDHISLLCSEYLDSLTEESNYDNIVSWFIDSHILKWCSRASDEITIRVIKGLYDVSLSRKMFTFRGTIFKGIVSETEPLRNTNRLVSYTLDKFVACKFIDDESRVFKGNPNSYLVRKDTRKGLNLCKLICKQEELTLNYNIYEDLEGYLCEEEIIDYDDFKI